MTQEQFIAAPRKEKRLPYQEKLPNSASQTRKLLKLTIAKVINRSPQIIHNEVRNGTVTQGKQQKQNGKIYHYYFEGYDVDAGQATYNRTQSIELCASPEIDTHYLFIDWSDVKLLLNELSQTL